MVPMAMTLADDQAISDVVEYIMTLSPKNININISLSFILMAFPVQVQLMAASRKDFN